MDWFGTHKMSVRVRKGPFRRRRSSCFRLNHRSPRWWGCWRWWSRRCWWRNPFEWWWWLCGVELDERSAEELLECDWRNEISMCGFLYAFKCRWRVLTRWCRAGDLLCCSWPHTEVVEMMQGAWLLWLFEPDNNTSASGRFIAFAWWIFETIRLLCEAWWWVWWNMWLPNDCYSFDGFLWRPVKTLRV